MREDVREARRRGRGIIAWALTFPMIFSFLSSVEPGFLSDRLWVTGYVTMWPWVAALGLYLVGLGWMVRIYRRSHLEPEASSSRYRDS